MDEYRSPEQRTHLSRLMQAEHEHWMAQNQPPAQRMSLLDRLRRFIGL